MTMIWHIFRKDMRLLWWSVLILAAVECGAVVMQWRADRAIEEYQGWAQLLLVLSWLGGAVLILNAVHQDVLVGVRQDWLVRPIRRIDLLGAKVLFVVLAVVVPYGVIEFVAAVARGFEAGKSVQAAFWAGIFMLLVWYLPALALGAVTKSVPQAVAAAVVGLVLVLAVMNSAVRIAYLPAINTGVGWVATTGGAVSALCGVALAVTIQYGRRATLRARSTAAVFGLGWWLILIMPFSAAMAVQDWVAPLERGGRIAFHPEDELDGSEAHIELHAERQVWIPVRAEGLVEGAWLRAEAPAVTLVRNDGERRELMGQYTAARNATSGRASLFLNVPVEWVQDGVTARLEAEIIGTVMRPTGSAELPLTREWVGFGGSGKCQAGVAVHGMPLTATCVQPSGAPLACVDYEVVGTKVSSRTCHTTYAPWGSRLDWTAVERFQAYPYGSSGELGLTEESRVRVRGYAAEKCVRMRLVIPEIALGDWVAAK